jgi:hypothetical protein
MRINPKILILSLGLLLMPLYALATRIDYGVKVGLNVSSLYGSAILNAVKYKNGLTVGGFVTIPILDPIAIEPEVLFSQEGGQSSTGSVQLNYIEVPLLIKCYLIDNGPIRPNIYVGPDIGALLSAQSTVNSVSGNLKSQIDSADYGIVIGGGLDINPFTIEFRYTAGERQISNMASVSNLKNGVKSILVGLNFN